MRDTRVISEGQPLPDGSGRRAGLKAQLSISGRLFVLLVDRMATSLTASVFLRRVANFPGSDDLVMIRRPLADGTGYCHVPGDPESRPARLRARLTI